MAQYRYKNVTKVKTMTEVWTMRVLMAVGATVMAICLLRVFTVTTFAAADIDVEEDYASEESKITSDDGDSADYGRIDVRLTRPGEAEGRLDEDGYTQVPGVERLAKTPQHEDSLRIPASQGRGVASAFADYDSADKDLIAPKRPVTSNRVIASAAEPQAAPAPAFHSSEAYTRVTDEPRPVRAGVYQEVSVIVSDHGYFPNRIFVTQDIPVKMYLTTPSKTTLCFMVDNWGVKKGIVPGKVEEVNFTPDRAGNYKFYCPVKGIEGIMTVREAPQPEKSRSVASESITEIEERPAIKPQPQKVSSFNEPKNAKELRALTDDE